MADIFEESGLSAGAIYGYFASKQEIVAAVADERHAFERALLAEIDSEIDPVGHFLSSYFGQFRDADLGRATVQYWAQSLSDAELGRRARADLRALTPARAAIARAQGRGLIRDDVAADVLARLVLAMTQGLLLQKCWQPTLRTERLLEAIRVVLASPPTNQPKGRKRRALASAQR